MKKLIVIFALIVCAFFSSNTSYLANTILTEQNMIYIDDDFYIIVSFEELDTTDSRSSRASKTVSKTYTIASDGVSLAAFKLTASFSYDGSTSTCTSASYTTTIHDDTWKFTEASASKSGNVATGSFSASHYILFVIPTQTVTKTITITCDANGNAS